MNLLNKKDKILNELESQIAVVDSLTDPKAGRILETLKKELLQKFPEFCKTTEFKDLEENDGTYLYYTYFANYLERLMVEDRDSEIVIRSFEFVNDVYESDEFSAEAWDLIGIELFEKFETESKYIELANKYLTGKASLAFQSHYATYEPSSSRRHSVSREGS